MPDTTAADDELVAEARAAAQRKRSAMGFADAQVMQRLADRIEALALSAASEGPPTTRMALAIVGPDAPQPCMDCTRWITSDEVCPRCAADHAADTPQPAADEGLCKQCGLRRDQHDDPDAFEPSVDECKQTVFVSGVEYDVRKLTQIAAKCEPEAILLSRLKWSPCEAEAAYIIVGPDNQVYDGNKRLTRLSVRAAVREMAAVAIARLTATEIEAAAMEKNDG